MGPSMKAEARLPWEIKKNFFCTPACVPCVTIRSVMLCPALYSRLPSSTKKAHGSMSGRWEERQKDRKIVLRSWWGLWDGYRTRAACMLHAHTHKCSCVQRCTWRVGRAMESLSHEHSTYHSDPKSLWHWVTAGLPVYSFVCLHVWTSLKCKTVHIKTCTFMLSVCTARFCFCVHAVWRSRTDCIQ